jgi:predicted SnoaL-like aldol condensation-catalyzing enzyme
MALSNKELILEFYEKFFNQHDIESAKEYVCENYIQHNPGVMQGREGLMKAFAAKFLSEPTFYLKIEKIISEDDMVAVYLKNVDPEGKTKCRVVDIYRIVDGKLAEHWDVIQPCS